VNHKEPQIIFDNILSHNSTFCIRYRDGSIKKNVERRKSICVVLIYFHQVFVVIEEIVDVVIETVSAKIKTLATTTILMEVPAILEIKIMDVAVLEEGAVGDAFVISAAIDRKKEN
jgi:hypothetical protein